MTEATQKPFIGLSRKDRARYSLARVIRSLTDHEPIRDGLEAELHHEVQRSIQHKSEGCLIPNDVFLLSRDLNVNTFGQGGAFVQTTVDENVIEILRNRTVCERMGVRRLSGLGGNVAIPRHAATVTAYSLPEQSTLTKSTAALDQILLAPHRVGAYSSFTRQLVLQSSVDVEQFLRDDLLATVNVKTDYLILQGQGGGSEPTGILNTAGIGNLQFGGAATWAQVVSFENNLALSNADGLPNSRFGFVTSPNVRNKWKTLLKTGGGISSTLANAANFIWEKPTLDDGTGDGMCNGYRAAVTNQVLNNLVFYGNWADCILAQFGQGVDLVVDPYTQATDATVRVTINSFIDVAIRHAASFCASEDAGNQ